MSELLYIFGAGGFAREVAWLVREAALDRRVEFLIDRGYEAPDELHGFPVRRTDEIALAGIDYVVAIGDPIVRRKIAYKCDQLGGTAIALKDPSSRVGETVSLAPGAIICAGSTLTVDIHVGAHVQVNLDCTIGHDVELQAFATLSPGVHISGNVVVGEGAFIGTGATVINGSQQAPLVVGDGSVVAAGACVVQDVSPGALVAGVPAVRKR